MLKVESYRKGIIFSTFFNILNKGLVFLNGILVVYFFGSGKQTDLFFYFYNAVLILGAFFSSVNGSVIIPESMRIREQEGQKRSMSFINFFVYLYCLLALICLTAVSFYPINFFSLISNFDKQDLFDNRYILLTTLPLFGAICIINLFIDILTSYKFFTAPMIVGITNGLFSILFIFVFHKAWNIQSALVGLCGSYSINLFVLIFFLRKRLDWRFNIITVVREKRIWRNFWFAQLGNLTSTASSYTPMYILSGFNTGIITALTFAQQIASLPTMLITYQFSSVAGIKFNELYAQKKLGDINKFFAQSANFLHFIMIPVGVLLSLFADDVQKILATLTPITNDAASYISLFLKYLALVIPLLVINSLIARLFMASHKIKESFWYQISFNIVLITMLFIAVKNYGAIGYPAAVAVTYGLNLVSCYFLERKYFNFIDYPSLIYSFLKMALVNSIIGITVYYTINLLHIINPVFNLIVGTFGYLILLAGLTFLLKLNEPFTVEVKGILKKNNS